MAEFWRDMLLAEALVLNYVSYIDSWCTQNDHLSNDQHQAAVDSEQPTGTDGLHHNRLLDRLEQRTEVCVSDTHCL